jgi:hypothetical protein
MVIMGSSHVMADDWWLPSWTQVIASLAGRGKFVVAISDESMKKCQGDFQDGKERLSWNSGLRPRYSEMNASFGVSSSTI